MLRWMRVLKTFDELEDMTASEAQDYADRGWERWEPVAAELGEAGGSAGRLRIQQRPNLGLGDQKCAEHCSPAPKGLAALWGIAMIFVLLSACGPQTDREALAALYHATSGPNWLSNENWLTDAPLEDWYGVSIDEDGRVIKLVLSANGLLGAIPPELVKSRQIESAGPHR